jgi:hypothetical protein
MQTYEYEYTDTYGGESNYSWVKRGKVHVPELTHYGYTGSSDGSYGKANKAQSRAIVTLVKRELGLTGVPCSREGYGDMLVLRPRGMATILFINYCEEDTGI